MCDPTMITTALTISGAVMGAVGSYQQAQAQREQINYQSGIARNNQIIAERSAKEIEDRGLTEANRYRSRVRQMQADQTIGLVAQGVDVTTGSSIDLLSDTAELGELDALTIQSNASREAYNARVQGANYGTQSDLLRSQAESMNPAFSAVPSLLSITGILADRWNRRRR